MSVSRLFARLVLFAALPLAPAPAAAQVGGVGIVASVVRAPVSPDGDVAGAVTDVVINLDVDPDPAVPGIALAAGESITVTLPWGFAFADEAEYPVTDLLGATDCVPGNLKCSTVALLQGWPQHPILPSFPPGETAQYTLDYDPTVNSLEITLWRALDGLPLPGPGLKQLHLLLFGFRNPPRPGVYPIRVAINRLTGEERASGVGFLTIRETPAPSINVTSVFVPGDENGGQPPNPNTIYQTTAPLTEAPMPWDFLLWNRRGRPYVGVDIAQDTATGGVLLVGKEVVGSFTISAPPGAEGMRLVGPPSIKLETTPVIGNSFGSPVPVGRMTGQFTAGSVPGRYYTTFRIDGGNSVTMVVDVVDPEAE